MCRNNVLHCLLQHRTSINFGFDLPHDFLKASLKPIPSKIQNCVLGIGNVVAKHDRSCPRTRHANVTHSPWVRLSHLCIDETGPRKILLPSSPAKTKSTSSEKTSPQSDRVRVNFSAYDNRPKSSDITGV